MARTEVPKAIPTICLLEAKFCVSCETIHKENICPVCANQQNIVLANVLKPIYTIPKGRVKNGLDAEQDIHSTGCQSVA